MLGYIPKGTLEIARWVNYVTKKGGGGDKQKSTRE